MTATSLFTRCGFLAGLLVLVSPAQSSRATTIANFTDGNITTSVDGYTGMAGSGWGAAWVAKVNNATSATILQSTVTDATPLAAGGNYLAFQASSPGSVVSSSAGVSRQYGVASGDVSLTQSIQYQFTFRPDAGSSTDYRYTLFDASAGQPSTGPNCTWTIVGTSSGWSVVNGTRDAGTGTQTATGAGLTLGTTYIFSILADPTTKSWSLSITDTAGTLLNPLTAATSYGFRSAATSLGGYLAFAVSDGTPTDAGTYGFSVDSIGITQVPEPSALGLLMVATVAGLGWKGSIRRKS